MSVIRNNYDLAQGIQETKKKMEQVLDTKADHLACYCPGCYTQLRGAAKKSGMQIHYSLEEILWALGDEYPVPYEERADKQTQLFIRKVKSSAGN